MFITIDDFDNLYSVASTYEEGDFVVGKDFNVKNPTLDPVQIKWGGEGSEIPDSIETGTWTMSDPGVERETHTYGVTQFQFGFTSGSNYPQMLLVYISDLSRIVEGHLILSNDN